MSRRDNDPSEGALSRQVKLTRMLYEDWEQEAQRLIAAAESAQIGGFVDGLNLVRAGEIADLIDQELVTLENVSVETVGESAALVAGVRDRLIALRNSIRDAARKMHGLTF